MISIVQNQLFRQEFERSETIAAIKIQSAWRGYSVKVKAEKAKRHLLSYALFEKAKPYVDNPISLQNLPRAFRGNTPVYLPNELPIVLKGSGSPQNQTRFDQMSQARDICEKGGYNNLVIPKARIYKKFILESRLPIVVHETKEQIGFYFENREQFTAAIKEFTGFLFQSTFKDITGNSRDPYGTLSKTPVPRYDNVALYIEDNQGKIGLVDLEKFEPGCRSWHDRWSYNRCRDAVHLFPFHFEEILDIAKSYDNNILRYRKFLEEERDEALIRFKLAYQDHLDFIKENKISFENPLKMVEVTPLRKEEIKDVMVLTVRKHDDGYQYQNCLGKKPHEILSLFEKSFPIILDLTINFISLILKKKVEGKKEAISSYRQLLSCRSLSFSSSRKSYKDLQEKVQSALHMMQIKEWDKSAFSFLIIRGIFEELAKGREIAYYNPSFGYGNHAKECIFC